MSGKVIRETLLWSSARWLHRSHYSPVLALATLVYCENVDKTGYELFDNDLILELSRSYARFLPPLLLRMNNGVGFLLRVTDVEKQPFRSMAS